MASAARAQLKVIPVVPDDVPVVYSNMVTVNRSSLEYFLTFCFVQLRPDLTPAQESVPATAKVQVILPPDVAKGLIAALQAQEGMDIAAAPAVQGSDA